MATAIASIDTEGEQSFILRGVSWKGYVAINDDVVDSHGLRMIYCDGRLTFLTKSRKHDWYAERFSQLVVALAEGLGIPWEDAAGATFRREDMQAGVEGDKTFYFGEHAEQMMGSQNVDLTIQSPPDLAIEVEISHPADAAMLAWGRLGVAEVWRFDPIAEDLSFWLRCEDGTYARSERGIAFPMVSPTDLLEQMRLADQIGAGKWHVRLGRWVQEVIRPRLEGGG